MFSFQAIHNMLLQLNDGYIVVIYQCQCSLFKQFTTVFHLPLLNVKLSFISVNVLFSSNSQLTCSPISSMKRCHLSVSMFSFQAIHNVIEVTDGMLKLSFISVNVLFSSNSQLQPVFEDGGMGCHLSVSMFSFQAIHNKGPSDLRAAAVVIYQCQCSLFKQFTTPSLTHSPEMLLSFISVNVLFSSNSQLCGGRLGGDKVVIYQCQCSLFKQFTTGDCVSDFSSELSFISVNVLFSSNSQP